MRWGGTRKGAGTFYTRPQLVVPIVQRTLAPLCFEPAVAGQAPRPRKPEQILALKVCDPAMGSGSFLVAALRYLTSALLQSLYAHERLSQHGERWHIRLADGLPLDDVTQESLPVPKDDSNLDDLLRARLKRHVVERCLYGVDLDALAVELARTALWVETMDYQLPFGFLDHKLKCGNSLVGAWLDCVEDYPIRAWDREGGDAKHANFVQHFRTVNGRRKGDPWNAALKDHRESTILPIYRSELAQLAVEAAGQLRLRLENEKKLQALHGEALAVMQELHDIIPIFDAERRADVYAAKIVGNAQLEALRLRLDTWCAVWFWPSDSLELAPTPRNFQRPSPQTRAQVARVAREIRFFHWELEFPDVMNGPECGFSAIIGNPPWETLQPASMEFFANIDPLYRTYTKQEALKAQKEYFRNTDGAEDGWIRYNAAFSALGNFTKKVALHSVARAGATDTEDGESTSVREPLRQRASFSDPEHPYRYQGSGKSYTYRMFLEVAHALLAKGGALGFLVPSGLYSDNGAEPLRGLFLDRCEWTHLYGFQNERYVFEGIHHFLKMAAIHLRKGARTTILRTRFRLGPGDSPEASELEEDIMDDARYLSLPIDRISRFSPNTRAILEIRTERDLRVLEKLYANGVLLGDQGAHGWRIAYRQGDFNMTSDSALFPPRPEWEAKGYKADEYGHWIKGAWRSSAGTSGPTRDWNEVRSASGREVINVSGIEDVALPLYQGVMFNAFQPRAKEWVSGTGAKAVWRDIDAQALHCGPQYLLGRKDWIGDVGSGDVMRLGYREVTNSTNTRTVIAAALPPFPCGHKVPLLRGDLSTTLALSAALCSFVTDWQVREKLGAMALAWFFVQEIALPSRDALQVLQQFALRLGCGHPVFAPAWQAAKVPRRLSWRRLWAMSPHERIRVQAIVDATVAELSGLDESDFRRVLCDCDHPIERVCNKPFSRTLNPKGFWRVDKDQQPELRQSVLAFIAFCELKKVGMGKFLALNGSDGWQLPATLCLADYDLGHDARAKAHQPVAAALGDRFLPWQLNEDVAASWEECRHHAELIERIVPSKTRSVPPPETLAPLSKAVPRATPAKPLVKALPATRKRVKQKA